MNSYNISGINIYDLAYILNKLKIGYRDCKWYYSGRILNPFPDAELLKVTIDSGYVGYIHGFFISSEEENNFSIEWTSNGESYEKIIVLGSKGSVEYTNSVAINEGSPADSNTDIIIRNMKSGNGLYQVGLLISEVWVWVAFQLYLKIVIK